MVMGEIMSNSVHNIIRKEYEKRQKIAFDNFLDKKEEVYAKLPEIEKIDSQIQFLGISFNKKILLGIASSDKIVIELSSQIEKLKKIKKQLLVKEGYPINYLETTYRCEKCKDTGSIDSKSGSERCICYKQQLIDLLYSQSNLKTAEIENFESFNLIYYPDVVDEKKYGIRKSPRQNILEIKNRCLSFVKKFAAPEEKNLFFSGSTGVGKTFMSNCVANEVLNQERTVLYQTAPMLFDIISEYKMKAFKDENFDDSKYKNLFKVELLIIDDLGTEVSSATRYAEFLNILNTRQINNLSRPCKTIISTNVGIKNLFESDAYTERVASRIMGSFDIYLFAGEDIRKTKYLNSVI
jgi:DNA replication protein DnaC